MFMKKGKNNKGAFNWTQFFALLLGLAVLVVVLGFVTGVFGDIGNIFDKFPKVEVTAQACGAYASGNLVNAYCNEFYKVEILGVKQYATCKHLEGESGITFDALGADECTSDAMVLAVGFCNTMKDKTMVNGKVCLDDSDDDWGYSKTNLCVPVIKDCDVTKDNNCDGKVDAGDTC